MKLVIFVDYDNLEEHQKAGGILDLVTKVLFRIPRVTMESRGACDVRVYGGWYEGTSMTTRAQDLAVAIQGEFPAYIRIPTTAGSSLSMFVNVELAVSMLEEPGFHLFDTYRRKGKPANIRVETPLNLGCVNTACPLPLAKKILKSGNCPDTSCAACNVVYRHEQKVVDTMLSCDLLYANKLGYDQIVLVSGDDDFLPPVRSALLRGIAIVRCHPKAGFKQTATPRLGASLTELSI